MAEHLIALWVRSDEDPAEIDWRSLLPERIELAHADVQTFPWQDVQHDIHWWITRRLTAEEWAELDDAQSEVLRGIVGADHFAGTAGPVPVVAIRGWNVHDELDDLAVWFEFASAHEAEFMPPGIPVSAEIHRALRAAAFRGYALGLRRASELVAAGGDHSASSDLPDEAGE